MHVSRILKAFENLPQVILEFPELSRKESSNKISRKFQEFQVFPSTANARAYCQWNDSTNSSILELQYQFIRLNNIPAYKFTQSSNQNRNEHIYIQSTGK